MIIKGTLLSDVGSGDALPTRFPIFKMGANETSKGTFILDEAGLASVMAAYKDHGVDLHVDYEHDMRDAAAWFDPMPHASGLDAGNVRWTPPAVEKLTNKAVRYTSPTFMVDDKKRIVRLINIALTNLPATKNAHALIAAKETLTATSVAQEPIMGLHEIIGLKADAPAEDIEARVVSLSRTESELLKVTGASNIGDAFGTVIAHKDAAVKLAAAEKSLREWHEAEERKAQDERVKEIASIIDQAVLDGRVSLKDTEKLATLRSLGEVHGVSALRTSVSLMNARPMRTYQAPVPANTVAEQLRMIEEYKKMNPGATTADAYIKLAAERPALFSQEVR